MFIKDQQYLKFCTYGFLKNLRLFEPFLLIFLLDEQLSFTQIGILYGTRELVRNIAEVPAGVFADVFGRKRSLQIAFVVYILSFLLFFWAIRYYHFMIAFMLYALADAFRTGTHKAMIMSYLKSKNWSNFKVTYYGHTRSWSQLGSAITALASGATIFILEDYRMAFLLSIIPISIQLLNISSYPSYLNFDTAGVNRPQLIKNQFIQILKDFFSSFRNPKMLQAVVSLSSYTGYYKAIKDYIQPVLAGLAITLPLSKSFSMHQTEAIAVGLVYFLIYLSTAVASRKAGLWVKKQGSYRNAMIRSRLLGGISGALGGLCVLHEWYALAVVCLFGLFIFEHLRKPVGIAGIVEHTDDRVLASALSAESQAETIFAAIFAVLLGLIIDYSSLGWGILGLSVALVLFSVTQIQLHRKVV